MATISPHKLSFTTPKFSSSIISQRPHKRPSYPYLPPRFPDSAFCRCCSRRSDSPSPNWRWWESVKENFAAFKQAYEFGAELASYSDQAEEILNMNREDQKPKAGRRGTEEDWDWDRWKTHFDEVDEQERLVSILKSQLARAVYREDYKDAAMLKVATAAAAKNDIVSKVMSNLNRAVEEERYQDAAIIRDNASAGLVGWWSGISDDSDDPYGLIVRITAEHGRYVARSFSPRQLASAADGVPLFEIYLTMNKKGEYKQQAVYLMRYPEAKDSSTISSRASGVANQLNPSGTEDSTDMLVVTTEDIEDADNTDDGYDVADGLSSFQNILRDMIPGAMVKVSKETASGKVDKDFMSKMIEDLVEEEDEEDEEDEEEDIELESEETDDEIEDSDQEKDEIEIDIDGRLTDNEEEGDIAVKIVVSGLAEKLSSNLSPTKLLRMPAKLDKKGRISFSFSIENYANNPAAKEQASRDKKSRLLSQRSLDNVLADLAKFIGDEKKIPMKVLNDVGELLSLTLSMAQTRQPLSGSTNFSRIEIPASSDPLNGLYIGSHGLYTSEVIHLRRKFGYWQEDGGSKDPTNLEFYEYVEALKLTGDSYVPAGQVAFRAKIGKRYQLPHKGVIPEEFGVIARYKGQGRLAEPGFQNPRWVDGELVILDGKYIKGGPVVGFVYWAPEYHFLVFFNRLRLQQ